MSGGRALLVTLAAVAAVCLLAGTPTVAASAQSDGENATTEANVSADVDAAVDETGEVATLESYADRTLGQYLGGVGVGLGVGLCIGGVVMYQLQSRRIEETFE